MSAIGWPAIEAAIAAWAIAASGVTAIWTYPGTTEEPGQRPHPPYLSLQLTDVRPIGEAAETRVDAGDQVKRTFRRAMMATLELQLFADQGSGEQGAVARLHDTLAALDVPEHYDALDDAGVGLSSVGSVRLVAGRINTLLEPRAVAEVELHLESLVESYVDYIARVTGTVNPTIGGGEPIAALPFDLQLEPEEES